MQCKALHLLRHAVAVHNQPEAAAKLPPEALFDPGLTAQGFAQAQALRPLVQTLGAQLVVTSPLTRALQTAVAVVASGGGGGGGKGQGAGVGGVSPPGAAASAAAAAAGAAAGEGTPLGGSPPPILAVEAVREAYGQYLPDKRRTRAELMAAFSPPVDMAGLPEEDALWTARRETLDSVLARARAFVGEVLRRPERRVLVVSHGVFIQCALQELLAGAGGGEQEGGAGAGASPHGPGGAGKGPGGAAAAAVAHPDYDPSRPVLNCELYTVIFVEMDRRRLLPSPGGPHRSPGLASPPLHHPQLWSPPGGAGGQGAEGTVVRQLLVTPATHELLASSGLAAQSASPATFFDDAVCWLARLFLAYAHGGLRLPLPSFTHLLTAHCGVPETFVCERYFRALDRQQRGALSFEDFLLGMVAMDPATANAGAWRHLRAEYVFRAYDLDEDGDLSFHDFKLVVEDMLRYALPPERRGDPGAVDAGRAEAEARRLHGGGRCSRQDFVSAVDKMAFRGTGVLFRVARSVVLVAPGDAARRQVLLDGAPPPPASPGQPHPRHPSSASTSASSSTGRTSLDGGRPSFGSGHRGGATAGGGGGRPPHAPQQTPSATVKVSTRQICFDVSKQRYSMSPHDKKPHRKLLGGGAGDGPGPGQGQGQGQQQQQQQQQQRRDSGGHGRRGSDGAHGLPFPDTEGPGAATPNGGAGGDAHHHHDGGAGGGVGAGGHSPSGATPPSPAQAAAHAIIRVMLDWDANVPLREPGVFAALGSLRELEPLFAELQAVLAREPTVLDVRAPCKVFGDIHGQAGDLLRLFRAYGRPDHIGDINLVDYVFNGDFVDRGPNSCDVVLLLFALKAAYPRRVALLRGNHESRVVNSHYGFRAECLRRLGDADGARLWEMCNSLFDHLPLAARVEGKILVLHGGLGATLTSVEQLQAVPRPIKDGRSDEEPLGQLLRDVLWSDPTASDTVVGLHDSPRGAGIALFGPDRVQAFCRDNGVDVVVRSHQVVDAGYEFFANKQLITVFSATDYCGQHRNDGAILEIDRDLVITPKLVSNQKTNHWDVARNSSPPRLPHVRAQAQALLAQQAAQAAAGEGKEPERSSPSGP